MAQFPNFPLEKFTVKFITMKGARGHSYKGCELAFAQLPSERFPLELITTHRFGLDEVDLAIRSVGGEGVADVIHDSLMPWLSLKLQRSRKRRNARYSSADIRRNSPTFRIWAILSRA